MSDWNKGIIEEFRKNHGKVGGYFAGRNLLLINHKGARTGQVRTNPVAYLKEGERYLIFASKGGAPTNPDWYHNLKANPIVRVEVGSEQFQARAVVVEGPEDE